MTDLKKFTNNDKRRNFFENRSEEDGWYVWFEEPRLNRRYERCDVRGTSFIVEMRQQTFRFPKEHTSWRTDRWYMVTADDWEKPFEDHAASMILAIEELKRLQKEATGK